MKTGFSFASSAGLVLLGACILLYPAVSNWQANQVHMAEMDYYENTVHSLPKQQLQQERKKAEDYNKSLAGDPVKDPFIPGSGMALPQNYLSVLNAGDVMCTIEIPGIGVNLPVYHGTSDEVLHKGVGHIEGTALPIGGKGGHAVLTGHTGLPTAHLFTDLSKMKLDDMFFIHVLDEEIAYQVDQIEVIEPDDISKLVAYKDEDYLTLVTCTPYGINSHRLLVRGRRSYFINRSIGLYKNISLGKYIFTLVVAVAFVLGALLAAVIKLRKRRKRRTR